VTDLMTEVGRFRAWADATFPPDRRFGEWECSYEEWKCLYGAVLEFLAACPFESWSPEEVRAVLYTLARDWEMQYLAGEVCRKYPDLLASLTRASIEVGECDNRWQLANELGQLGRAGGEEERLLLLLVRDEHEYVRRRALGALARLGSLKVEKLALEAWHRPDPHQQWARMMALWSLHRVGSPQLGPLLVEAEQDPREHLRVFAERVRRGEVHP
jgi:hypothetical protein